MRYSESWLREWVNPDQSIDKIANLLTMSGIEVEEILPAAMNVENVCIGEVIDVKPEKKSTYNYNIDLGNQVVSVTSPLLIPMHAQTAIKKTHEIYSICLKHEMGLSEKSDELFLAKENVKNGTPITEYLDLNDRILNASITPNRGDCLSMRGLAREIATNTREKLTFTNILPAKVTTDRQLPITVEDSEGCYRYVGRVIEGVNNQVASPVWLQERLRRVGARSINFVVDVMNYVMFEIGQPMHAFDLKQISEQIIVRRSVVGEKIILLDETERELIEGTYLIADKERPLAIAGVMGGLDSGVTEESTDLFLESIEFNPSVIAKEREWYSLNSESSYRFERGIDPTIQQEAIERATQLILEIAGGKAGPIVDIQKKEPAITTILLAKNKPSTILGVEIQESQILDIFKHLHFTVKNEKNHWEVTVPSFRHDLKLPEDLVEEIARIYGYDSIPSKQLTSILTVPRISNYLEPRDYQVTLARLGYHEVLTYSFIDNFYHTLFFGEKRPYELKNPISHEMAVMRGCLLPGLLKTYLYNHSRQQTNIRLFEIGTVFVEYGDTFTEEQHLAMLLSGNSHPEQWGLKARPADFYDLKGDIERLLEPFYPDLIQFEAVVTNVFHPGQAANVFVDGVLVGRAGLLHPKLLKSLDIQDKIFAFELNLIKLCALSNRTQHEVSKFPEIRRDVAILIDQAIPVKEIQDTIKETAGNWLKALFIFDVYQGEGITSGLKSVALALILQNPMRTLIDEEVAELMDQVTNNLKGRLGAELRS